MKKFEDGSKKDRALLGSHVAKIVDHIKQYNKLFADTYADNKDERNAILMELDRVSTIKQWEDLEVMYNDEVK